MKQIDIVTDNRNSRILIDRGAIERVGELIKTRDYSSVFVIVDETARSLHMDKLKKNLPGGAKHFAVPSGEAYKNIDTVQEIWKAMHKSGCDRKTLVINFGGGVLCDIGGFAASTYMRGVDFVHVPTTLLAQVDASVGGKTGVNFDGIKNLVGTFSQPMAVVIDPSVLKTLPPREFTAGFGEIIKHGLIADRDYLHKTTKESPLDFTTEELESIIARSCRIKADIVNNDSKEVGIRKAVNFGHTVGHAVEALSLALHPTHSSRSKHPEAAPGATSQSSEVATATPKDMSGTPDTTSGHLSGCRDGRDGELESKHPLLHGEAVAVGMVVEAGLSRRKGMISEADVELVRQSVVKAGLPHTVPKLPIEKIMETMCSDKKNQAGSVRFTLLESIGKTVYDQEIDTETVRKVIEESMER